MAHISLQIFVQMKIRLSLCHMPWLKIVNNWDKWKCGCVFLVPLKPSCRSTHTIHNTYKLNISIITANI